MSRPYVFISELPALNSLECYTATAEYRGKQELQEKCRELTRGDSAILISPVTEDVHFRAATLRTAASSTPRNQWNVVLIAKVGYLRNDKFQVKLRQQGLMLVSQITVTDEIMASCYSFSLKARLSPKWNRVSTWLIQGLEFLHGGRVKAVELHVAVNNGELALTIHTKALVLSLLQPEDLGVSLPLLGMFQSGARKRLSEEEMEGRKCYILPNCTLGFVNSVSSEYTPVPHLPSYEHIRLYWKKQYGYILPEKETLNFKIYFRRNPGMILSYPGSCVLKCPPHSFPTRESNSIATSFLSDAFQRLPSIGGCRLSFATKCFMPKSQLQCASSAMLGVLKQVCMPATSVTPSAAEGSTVKETSLTHVGAKRSATPLMNNSDQMVPGRHEGCGSSNVASTQHAGNAKKAAQPNKSVYVPKFSKPHATPAPPSVSATLQPPAKKPAHKSSASNGTPTIQRPAQTPARGPSQAPTESHQRASTAPTHTSLPTRGQLQPTPTSSQKPNSTTQSRPSAADGGAPTASKSRAIPSTQSMGSGPFQQVPASLMSAVEDDDAFYPSTHSKEDQSTSVQRPTQVSLPLNETNMELARQMPVSKAKVADLKKWLWQNGVQFKTKGTKKEDLVRLVSEHTRRTGKAFDVL